jgi:class 3 adenylate cyclase
VVTGMSESLADALPREIARVQRKIARYVEYKREAGRHAIGFNVTIALMQHEVDRAIRACAEGDVAAMVSSLQELRENDDDD